MRTFGFSCVLTGAFFLLITSCQAAYPPIESIEELRPDFPPALIQEGLEENQVGYILYDPETKNIVEEKNSDEYFIPSSLNKIIPTTFALKTLGPEYRFKTTLHVNGNIRKGVLAGDLYLRGGSDPSLMAQDLMKMAAALKELGIKRVDGQFYFDESAISSRAGIALDRDFHGAYNMGVSALSSEFNQAFVSWQRDSLEPVLKVALLPALPFIKFGISAHETSLKNPLLYDFTNANDPRIEQWAFYPALDGQGSKKIPIKHAGLATASLFRMFATMQGIYLPEPAEGKAIASSRVVHTHLSPPLHEILGKGLEFSNNLVFELTMIEAAKKIGAKNGSIEEAAALTRKWIMQTIKSCKWDGFVMPNGSGLGSQHRSNPKQLLEVFKFAEKQNLLFLLPAMGWAGTLEKRQKNAKMALRIFAKSGSQSYSNTLGGYLFTSAGKKLIFVIMTTDFINREEMDQWPSVTPEAEQKAADEWGEQAKTTQEALLYRWLEMY